ncbi:hypothetical protein BDV12DRAFT_195254 [Aspergillus spectabilis]
MFELKVDPTLGGKEPEENIFQDKGPNEAPFGFVIMTSPQEIQQSLVRCDGSHWEMIDCFDGQSASIQHGAPGTIIQRPQGYGPGKYVVLKGLQPRLPSATQFTPGHLAHRIIVHDTIYDLTFDYNFKQQQRHYIEVGDDSKAHGHHLGKRAKVYGHLLPRLPGLSCPGAPELDDLPPCPFCGSEDDILPSIRMEVPPGLIQTPAGKHFVL